MADILITTTENFPFDWANLESYRDSFACRKEIYLKEDDNVIENLIFLFHYLFQSHEKEMVIYNKSWWDFCLDTWDVNKEEYNYDVEGKSLETQEYFKILGDSKIQIGYSGCCKCSNLDKFLSVILKCIINHIAPYSPLFCAIEDEFFFYFHHTGSIGVYYKSENQSIKSILSKASNKFLVTD